MVWMKFLIQICVSKIRIARINNDFIGYYTVINKIVDDIPILYPVQNKEHRKVINEFISLSQEGKIAMLGAKIEDFLVNKRDWKLEWGMYDEEGTMKNYLNSTMLCIECLDLARVSNRSGIYDRLFS